MAVKRPLALAGLWSVLACQAASPPQAIPQGAAAGSVAQASSAATPSDMQLSPGLGSEPSLAIYPSNREWIAAAWIHPGSIQAAFTSDHGASWTSAQDLPVVFQTTGHYAADPSVAWNRAGVAYVAYLNAAYSSSGTPFGTQARVLLVQTTPQGVWSSPTTVRDLQETTDWGCDRPWLVVDDTGGVRDGTLYLTSKTGVGMPDPHVHLKTSTDDGATWSADIQVDDVSDRADQDTTATPTIGADGTLDIIYYARSTGSCTSSATQLCTVLAQSSDGAQTFSYTPAVTITVAPSSEYERPGVVIAAHPSIPGRIVLAWVDGRGGDPDIFFSRSFDNGATWSAPLRLNDDPVGNDVAQDEPWIAYAPNGAIGAAWRDRRNGGPGEDAPFDIFATYSFDLGTQFVPNLQVTSQPSPVDPNDPNPPGNDFIGVGMNDQSIYANWGDSRSGQFQVYFERVQIR